ncbi:hypothetical protein FOT80_26710 [Serratia fonticola]|nr:hypothetical protein [Serratia fonticola]
MKCRKKAVVVDAIQFIYSEQALKQLHAFCGDALGDVVKARHPEAKAEAQIKTLEDGRNNECKHIATEGDYIIKGVKGEFYPCKPDIFHETYDVIGE